MKIINYSSIRIAIIALLVVGGLFSCEQDEKKKITVNNVYFFSTDSTTGVITEARVRTLVRIEGSGFSGLRAVYCNGVAAEVNPNFVTDVSILFALPTVPVGNNVDESVRNTIRLVTASDDYTFPFSLLTTPPVAVTDTYSTPANSTLTIAKDVGVLVNDRDADNDKLSAVLVSTTSHGTLTFDVNGSFVYTPNAGYTGDDSFTYYSNDGNANSSTVIVTIKVTGDPVITGVSHTLAKVGETISIYGLAFATIDSVIFPGNQILTKKLNQFSVNSLFSTITCVIPSGVTKGQIVIKGGGKSASSSNYMFRDECRIINFSFSDGYGGSFGSLTALSATTTTSIPSGGNPLSPSVGYRYCPNTAPPSTTTCPINSTPASGFNFSPATAAQKLIANTSGLITATTKCKDLAMQMDFYMAAPWGSGFFKVNFKPGTESYSGIMVPQWITIGNGQDITMTGWLTATLPLEDVPSLQTATVQDVINTLTANGTFTFVNTDLTLNGSTYPAKQMTNFQLFMGALRIVPYKKPQ